MVRAPGHNSSCGAALQSRRGGYRRGVALLDALIAAILLGVALAAIVSVASTALASGRLGQEIATAATLADEQLQLVLARGPDDYARRFPVKGACDAPFQAYRYELSIGQGSAGQAYKVSATVAWDSARGPQSIVVETLIAAREAGENGERDPVRTPQNSVEREP